MASFQIQCDQDSAFFFNPNAHKCIGYLTSLGLTSSLAADILVTVPFNAGVTPAHFTGFQKQATGPTGSAKIVGVLDTFSWAGGTGDAILLDFWVSQSNAMQLKNLSQTLMNTAKVNALAWWIGDYDTQAKAWYEKAYPVAGSVTGLLQGKANAALNVDLTPVPAEAGIDVNVYKISLSVGPAANNQYSLVFANSSSQKVVQSWGLVAGT